MPKISKGGVSNRLVDPEFIAEPGTPVEVAIDEGRPNVGKADTGADIEQPSEDTNTQVTPENSGDTPAVKRRPRKATLPK